MIFDLPKQLFDEMTRSFNAGSPPLPTEHFRAAIEAALKKCNVVTREEFDAQQAVLLRTREKVDALELQLAALEKQLAEQEQGQQEMSPQQPAGDAAL